MLSPVIRDAIYSIYGFVLRMKLSIHGYDKESLITEFEDEYYKAKERGIN
jgi:hypothetical protein